MNFEIDIPEAEHVAGHLSVDISEVIVADGAPRTSVTDLKSSFIAESTACQPHFCTTQ